jgi:hypothetical protein
MKWLATLVTTPEKQYWCLTQGHHSGIGGRGEMHWYKQWESETDPGRWTGPGAEAKCREMAAKLNRRGE